MFSLVFFSPQGQTIYRNPSMHFASPSFRNTTALLYYGVLETGKMITIPITAGIVGEVVRTKRLRNVADTSKDRRV